MAALGGLLVLGAGSVGATSNCHRVAAPNCDFGDAPDGHVAYAQGPGEEDNIIGKFPSLRTSQGSAHSRVFPAPLLRLGTAEDPEGDSKQINVDTGDDGFSRRLTRCKVGKLRFKVDTRRLPNRLLTRGHRIFLNFWSDWNFDGDWRDVDTRCGKRKRAGGARAGTSAARNPFGDSFGNPRARRRLRSTPVPEWRVQNFSLNAARFARRRIQTIVLKVRAGGQVADFGPKKGQQLAPFECHRAVVTIDQRFARRVGFPDLGGQRGRNDGRGSFGFGETEDYCPFSEPFGPPPPPPPGPGEKRVGPFQLSGGTLSSTCNPAFTYFFDVYIPQDAVGSTHQLLQPGNDNPIVPPICPGMSASLTVTEYGPGVTPGPPTGSPPPAGHKTYRVTIEVDGTQSNPSQSFDIKVSYTNP